MKRPLLVGLVILAAGCGGEEATESETSVFIPPPPPSEDAFAPPDTLGFFPEADSLVVEDSQAVADSILVPEAPPAAPSFAPFLQEFKQALQTDTADQFAGPDLPTGDLALVTEDPAFLQRVLATPPDRFRREGTQREVWVVVGYDMDGNVVPEDEAETESGLGLVFDVVDGAYRLVRVDSAG
ncbi:MAG: hypothetical protein AAGI52_13835 [Bacteroidota bacterium]